MAYSVTSFVDKVRQTLSGAVAQAPTTLSNIGNRVSSSINNAGQQAQQNIIKPVQQFAQSPQVKAFGNLISPMNQINEIKAGAQGVNRQMVQPTLNLVKQGLPSAIKLGSYIAPGGRSIANAAQNIATGMGSKSMNFLNEPVRGSDLLNSAGLLSIGKVVPNMVGGYIGTAFKAGENIYNKQPLTTDLGKAYDQGFNFTAQLGPVEKFTSWAATPLTNKLAASSPIINKIIQKLTPGEVTGFKSWVSESMKQGNKSGLSMSVFGALQDAKNPQEALKNVWEQYKAGFVFGGASKAASNVIPGLVKPGMKVAKDTASFVNETFPTPTSEQIRARQGGFVNLKAAPDAEIFSKPYKRGDITKVVNEMDNILGVPPDMYFKQKANLRESNYKYLMEAAQAGAPGASDDLARVDQLRRAMDNAQVANISKNDPVITRNTQAPQVEPIKAVDPLTQEAKKYKSAEEFVKAQSKFVHETNAPDIKEFDMSKIGSGQGEAWLGHGVYLQEKGGFKIERYGKNKVEAGLTPNAKIFKVEETPNGKWRDSFVEWYAKKHPELESGLETWENPKNVLPRDLLRNRGEYDFGTPTVIKELRDAGYDGLLQDGELVVYNPKVLKTKSQLTDLWNKANKADGALPTSGNVGAVKLNEPIGGKSSSLQADKVAQMDQIQAPEVAKATTVSKPQLQVEQAQKSGGDVLSNNPQNPSSPGSIPEDPIQKVIRALSEAKPLRGQQESIYAKMRSKQAGAIANIGKTSQGESAYFKQLGQLKGEMPKVTFESIRSQLDQPTIDSLFNKVEQSNLSPFEKITAKSGLAKLFGAEGGNVPQRGELSLLNEIFPKEFIDSVLEKRSTTQKLFSLAEGALNLPRSIMATADLSAPLRQGALLIGRPKQWIPAFRDMFKYALSEDAYKGLQENIKSRPTYKAMRESGLALTSDSALLQNREEAFMSNLTDKIPVFGKISAASNRAYSGFLNKLRADTFDDLYKSAKDQGIVADRPGVIADIAKFVNTATGRGDLGAFNRASTILNGVFFSPRLMASRLNTLNPIYYVTLDPFVRKEALKSLFTFAGTAATVLGLSKLAGADVGTDPRSADFGKIKIGNTRYDPWGGFQQYMVLASRLLTGQMVSSTTGKEFNLGEGYKSTTRMDIIQRFFESKESPVASFITGFLKGKTSVGESFSLPVEVADRFMPMMAQDMYDLYRANGLKGIGMAIPGMFGVGSQTYTDQIPMSGKTATGRPNIQWRQAPGLGETIINKVTGNNVSDVPQDQWKKLYEEKQTKTLRDIELAKIKATVLETGKDQTFGDTLIYMDNGIVKTKKITPTKTKQPTLKLKAPKRTSAKQSTRATVKMGKVKITKAPKVKKVTLKKYKPKFIASKPLRLGKMRVRLS